MTDEQPRRRHRRDPAPTPMQVLAPAAAVLAGLLLVALVVSPGSFAVHAERVRDDPAGAAVPSLEPSREPVASPQPAPPRAEPVQELLPAEEVEASLEALLDVRDAAVVQEDPQGWLDTLGSPSGDSPDGGFSVLVSLPLTRFESTLAPGSLTPAHEDDGPGPRWQARVETLYVLDGGPGVRRTDTVRVVPATGGDWRIDSWQPYPEQGGLGTPAPWELGPVASSRSGRSVVLSWADVEGQGRAGGADGTAAALAQADQWGDRVAAWTDRGATTVDSFLGTGWPRQTLVLAPATPEQYEALVPGESRGGPDVFAAVTVDTETSDGPGDLVVLNPSAQSELVDETWQVTVTHELVHVASGSRYGDDQEVWLAEGLADLVGWSDVVPGTVSREQVAGRLLQRVGSGEAGVAALPRPDDFSAADADQVGDAYEGSWLAVLLLQDELGEAGVLELYAAASEGPGTARQRTDRALRDATGTGRAAFEERWGAYLAELAG